MAKIIIQNNRCYLKEETDIDFVRVIDDELSFIIPEAKFMPAGRGFYRGGKHIAWDGMYRILSGDLSFPIGLLGRISSLYRKNQKNLQVIDNRFPKSPISNIDISQKLIDIGKIPRDYQCEILEAVKTNDYGIIRSCTGSGKTLVSAMMAAYFGKPTILYVIGKDLLHQTYEFFTRLFDDNVGIIGDGECKIRDINIASVWTLGQAFGLKDEDIIIDGSDDETKLENNKYFQILDMLKIAKVHIFDECHLAACATIQELAKRINPEYVYGMSASPWRDDNRDMLIEGVFGKMIIDIPASRLINAGWLAKPYIKFIQNDKLKEKVPNNYHSIYKAYITENDDRNEKIVKWANKLTEKGYQVLVSYTRIQHGKKLFNLINKTVPSVLLSGKDSNDIRSAAKNDLEQGKIKVILASSIFDIGVDLPSLSGLIIAGAGKSSVRALQRIGRVIRSYPGKKRAAIIDFKDKAKFLKDHSVARYNIYKIEEAFDVTW
jgi:superfamily II DNA or RNA helicase